MRVILMALILSPVVFGDEKELKREVEYLRKELEKAKSTNLTLRQEKRLMLPQIAEVRDQLKSARERLAKLKAEEADLDKKIRALRNKEVPGAKEVSGKVVEVRDGLFTANIGSDDGVKKGMILEIFRLGTSPRYLGGGRVIDVEKGSCVLQPTTRMTMPIRKGDHAASSKYDNSSGVSHDSPHCSVARSHPRWPSVG